MCRDSNWFKNALLERGLLFRHDGNPKRPHPVLSSGLHTTEFANIRELMSVIEVVEGTASAIAWLVKCNSAIRDITRVMGSAESSIGLAYAVASKLGTPCVGFTSKVRLDGSKMVCKFNVSPNERILFVEDMETTGHTTVASMKAVQERQSDVVIIPDVYCVLAWRNTLELPGIRVHALIDETMSCLWRPAECELCKAGSEAIAPKTPGNWERLNAHY